MPAQPATTRGRPPANPAAVAAAGKSLDMVQSNQWLPFLGQFENDFTRVLPGHVTPQAFIGLAAAYVRRDPKLQEAVQANPGSLVLALRECAALGHLPMKDTFSLVPFNDRTAPNGKAVVGIETYQGVIERMWRAGAVTSVHVEVVREHDQARWRPTEMILPYHDFDEFADDADRGHLKAVYAWAKMNGGATSQVAWLPKGQVLKHRKVSRSGDAFWGPEWPGEGPWTQDMWKKTALHVLEKFVPTSASYRAEVARTEVAAATGFVGVPDRSPRAQQYAEGPAVVEAQLVDEPTAADARPQGGDSPVDNAAEGGTGWPPVPKPGEGRRDA